jgi:hypothetical protein
MRRVADEQTVQLAQLVIMTDGRLLGAEAAT